MTAQRPLTDEERGELDALNAAVQEAIDTRREWLDAKMHEVATLKVGDDIYDIESGRKLGVVSRLYRYHTNQNALYDTHVTVDYEYETSPRCFGNTSSRLRLSVGTREEAASYAKRRADRLARAW
ncbi:hypothetical protein [Tsukamurella paurometabola]|uniref:Bacteriophage protein n=1 Tax=Tsukamurella paurometabola TaxID=2061 RepID=A0ABS5NDV9_TSUPA|nr:hypothetical protein [Tsukamurella paurometabola]MBS4102418.1 hypothetical protein [Tsukamurella paurometabola]